MWAGQMTQPLGVIVIEQSRELGFRSLHVCKKLDIQQFFITPAPSNPITSYDIHAHTGKNT